MHCVIDYTYMVIDYQQLLNALIQILKLVIDYTHTVIDYQRRFSENIFNSHIFCVVLEWLSKAYIYVTWDTNLTRVLKNKKVLSS